MSFSSNTRQVYVASCAALLASAVACSENSNGQSATGQSSTDSQVTPANGGSPRTTSSTNKSGTVAQGGTSSKVSSSKGAAIGGSSAGKATSGDPESLGGNNSGGSVSTSSAKASGGTVAASSSRGESGAGDVGRGGASKGGTRNSTSGGESRGGTPSSTKTAVTGGATSSSSKSSEASGGTNVSTGGTADSTLVPDKSWDCGMPTGIVSPASGELVLSAKIQIGKTYDVGATQFGKRRIFDLKGGTLTGDRVNATFLTGGLDLELTLSNGNVELEQVTMLRASDGTLIYLRTCGVAQAGDSLVRIVPDFEVGNSSSLAWLNTGKFVGTRAIDTAAGTMELSIYDVSKASTSAAAKVQLQDPAGVPNQSWECSTATGGQGASVFTETVGIGSSLSVGASKRGTRNVIPITGGTVTGRVTGSVLVGGADFQLTGSGATKLDARYTLSTKDGEFISVRNCGPFGGLVPTFEARAEGPYSFLNANTFVSSDPGGASGGVSITFYERK